MQTEPNITSSTMQTEPSINEKPNIIATEPIISDTKTNVMGFIPNSVNVLSLAYLGDAVWEIFVRERVIRSLSNANHADVLHKKGIHYVNASSQAKIVKKLINDGILTEEEIALVKRSRNHRTATKAKNADAITYKWATAFESLLGFLYLSKEDGRLKEIMELSASILESPINSNTRNR